MPKHPKREAAPKFKAPTALSIGDATQSWPLEKLQPITAEQAMALLGWEEVENADDSVLFQDKTGKNIRCRNSTRNRPFRPKLAERKMQDILNKKFRFNGQPVIISKSGQVADSNHTLVGLVWAKQKWEGKNVEGHHWREIWKTEPYIEKLVVYGAPDDPEVIRTLDDVAPRTEADVLITSGYFPKAKGGDREKRNKILANAVRTLWAKTGEAHDPYTPDLTNSEVCEYVDRHKKLLEAVEDMYSEDLARYCSTGYAAALMYMMAASSSDYDAYHEAGIVRSEKKLDFKHWDKAHDFWIDLASRRLKLDTLALFPVAGERGHLIDGYTFADPKAETRGSLAVREATLIKAWAHYIKGEEVTEADVRLAYRIHYLDDGKFESAELIGHYRLDGIWWIDSKDKAQEQPQDDIDARDEEEAEVKAEEATERKKQVDKERAIATPAKNGKKVETKPPPKALTSKSTEDELEEYHEKYPGRLLFFKRGGGYSVWGKDADTIGPRLKLPVKISLGLNMVEVPIGSLDDVVGRLAVQGYKVAVCDRAENGAVTAEDVVVKPTASTAKPSTVKPPPRPKVVK